MGGPCLIVAADGSTSRGPAATDNFLVRPFFYHGTRFFSVEAAFQACKHGHGSARYARIAALAPLEGESDAEHGCRAWAAGQGGGQLRPDWDVHKVGLMLDLARARTAQHADLRAALLATGSARLRGAASTAWALGGAALHWGLFNGLIMMVVREELRREAAGGAAAVGPLEAEARSALLAYERGEPAGVLAAYSLAGAAEAAEGAEGGGSGGGGNASAAEYADEQSTQ